MDDAKYFRAQAELSLEIARQLSDPVAAKRVRLTAASFLAKAEQLERKEHNEVATDRGSQPTGQPARLKPTQHGPWWRDLSR